MTHTSRTTEYITDPFVDTRASLQRMVVLLQEISDKLDRIAGHGEEQVAINRSMAHFTQTLTGTAVVDDPVMRPPFSDYRENASGDGWDVFVQYPNQVGEWYPANASELQEISERNARRRNKH